MHEHTLAGGRGGSADGVRANIEGWGVTPAASVIANFEAKGVERCP